MKITTVYRREQFVILNNDREIGCFWSWSDFNEAANRLAQLQEQLARPEAFCDCKPKQEVSRG